MNQVVGRVFAFFTGVGVVNACAYPYLRDYQERT